MIARCLRRTFSTSSPRRDAATCQLLGRFGSTPTTFQTSQGRPAVRYLFAVNRGAPNTETQTTSWFNVVSFDERAIERLTSEDLKGAKALINANFDVKKSRDEETGSYTEVVNIRQTGMHIIERKRTQGVPSEEAQASALEDSFSV